MTETIDGFTGEPVDEDELAAHRRLVLRIAAYFDAHIRPTLLGVPDDVIIRMRARYIIDVRRNPEALRYFTEEVSGDRLRGQDHAHMDAPDQA